MGRLRAQSFRWSAPDDTEGYAAAEVCAGTVRWFEWSHIHGRGCREFGTQGPAELALHGPPLPVPAPLLSRIVRALEASVPSGEAP